MAARLQAIGRQVIILESHRAGQIGKSYLVNDKLDAAKIARIYLSGLSIHVWAPDSETRQRRELLSTYQRCVKESTRAQQHLRSFLNEYTVRLPKGFRLCRPQAIERLLALRDWSPRQKLLLQEMHGGLIATRERRQRLRRLMALEIEEHPEFLRLYKLAGLNLVTTYALIAVIGRIERFAHSKKTGQLSGAQPQRRPKRRVRGKRRVTPARTGRPARPAHPSQQTATDHEQPTAKVGPLGGPAPGHQQSRRGRGSQAHSGCLAHPPGSLEQSTR